MERFCKKNIFFPFQPFVCTSAINTGTHLTLNGINNSFFCNFYGVKNYLIKYQNKNFIIITHLNESSDLDKKINN